MFRNDTTFSSFSTDNLAAAADFYRDLLGLKTTTRPGLLELLPGGGGKVIIYHKSDHVPAIHTVLNFEVRDIQAAAASLAQAKVALLSYDLPNLRTDSDGICRSDGGPKVAWFTDPAGNILSVVEMPEPPSNTNKPNS